MAGSQTPIWTIKKYSNDDTKNSSLKFHKVSENASFVMSVYRMMNSNKYFRSFFFFLVDEWNRTNMGGPRKPCYGIDKVYPKRATIYSK